MNSEPLIIQIQQAALDSRVSLTDALRKAKVAAQKLNLPEFGAWIDSELDGYTERPFDELPAYRRLQGLAQGYTSDLGWFPLPFSSSAALQDTSLAPIGMPIGVIDSSLTDAKSTGTFTVPYSPEHEALLRAMFQRQDMRFRIRLDVPRVKSIIDAVRNILLNWTIKLEKEGILGEHFAFSNEEREKSAPLTATTVNHIRIDQVGAFVQAASNSNVQGSVSASDPQIVREILAFVQQTEGMLPGAQLEESVQRNVQAALTQIKTDAESSKPETDRLRAGLIALKNGLVPAGEHLFRIAVDIGITKILGQ